MNLIFSIPIHFKTPLPNEGGVGNLATIFVDMACLLRNLKQKVMSIILDQILTIW